MDHGPAKSHNVVIALLYERFEIRERQYESLVHHEYYRGRAQRVADDPGKHADADVDYFGLAVELAWYGSYEIFFFNLGLACKFFYRPCDEAMAIV